MSRLFSVKSKKIFSNVFCSFGSNKLLKVIWEWPECFILCVCVRFLNVCIEISITLPCDL